MLAIWPLVPLPFLKQAWTSGSSVQSLQFSHSVMSDPLRPHELQHTRPPCLSPTAKVHSDSCLSSRWCHPAISSSVVAFFSCPQSLPPLKSFPMSQLFTWGGQSTGVSALSSFLPKKSQEITVHVLLKPGLENFEHYFTSVWDECNCAVVWAFFGIAFLWDWNESWPFPVLWPLLSFPNLLAYQVQHFHSIIFQDLQ